MEPRLGIAVSKDIKRFIGNVAGASISIRLSARKDILIGFNGSLVGEVS